ncbi:MAG: class I SAM-dependent methyltransferase [Candidatus Scalindua sp.]
MNWLDIDYYEQNAREFFQATYCVDLSSLYDDFLKFLPCNSNILDVGCGSGRDSKAFLGLGYRVLAIDASPAIAKLAEKYIQQPVEICRAQDISYVQQFDGIWACASLLHVPRCDLSDTLQRLLKALKPDGILYVSFKYGSNEYERDGRHFTNMNEAELARILTNINGFREIKTWITEDFRPDRLNENWLNILLQAGEGEWKKA